MPPEQLPWDRRDFRKHERSGSDPRFGGGGFGGGGPHRWREQYHQPPSHPPPYHHHHNHHHQQQRWYSDFRSSRPIPPGHGKQGGWNMYPDEAGPGFLPFGSRYADRNLDDDNFRPFGSRGEGRYLRNTRENRGSFSQKEWRSSSWEPAASPNGPGRPTTDVNNQKSLENTQTCHNNNSKSNDSTHPLPDSVSGQSQPLLKEKHEKNAGTVDGPGSSGQKCEKENGLGSIDWNSLKWTRSGSLSLRGSGFSHSSSSKSMAVDSNEIVAEVQQKKNVTPVQSRSPAVACVASTTLAAYDEIRSRKKPRLGWGEGLAKYEKKKVEGPEDGATKDGLAVSVSNAEIMQSPSVNLLDKSPRFASLSDCTSPATPSSVACSSSPGIEEKQSFRAANVDHEIANFSCSPTITSLTHYEGPNFNLENLELATIANLSSFLNELLQPDDPSSVEMGCVRTTSLNKLLVWKVDVLKALEVTESEVDSLETELKSLIDETRSCTHPAASSLPLGECHLQPCQEQVTASSFTVEPAPLQIVSSVDVVAGNRPAELEDKHAGLKDDEIDSPGSATSKLVEALPSVEDAFPCETAEHVEGLAILNLSTSSNSDKTCSDSYPSDEDNTGNSNDHKPSATNCQNLASFDNVHCDVDHIYDSILASNKDSANRALEELNKLLPAKQCLFDISIASSVFSLQRDTSAIKEKFLLRKRSLQFKEKVLTLRFRAFHHFWKESRVVSVRKLRGKSHKKFDLSRTGFKKNRSSCRSRISYLAGSFRTVPAEEVIKFVNGMLLELRSPLKPCRTTLKMPALVLDKATKMSRFLSNNGLVEDPCAAENERSMINPWTAEEREIFIDKLAIFGKNFVKIASFLDHKTVADCIEFYYKNHKSECFERARKKPDSGKQRNSQSTTYLVAAGKRWNREVNAASLDILGEASVIAANVNDGIETQHKSTSRIFSGASGSHKTPTGCDGPLARSNSLDLYTNETVAADVLAGICGSISSEAMSSCITSSVDPADGHHDWKSQRVSSCVKRPLTPDVTQHVDDESSDESCGEMDPSDWTDEEKSIFIQAVSSYGKDFVMISQCVRTRSRDQCKIFFSKARKCLGLDLIQPGAVNTVSGDDVNGGGSDIEDECVVGTDSVIQNDSSKREMEGNLLPHDMKLSHESDIAGTHNLMPDFKTCGENSGPCPLDSMATETVSKNSSLVDKPVIDFNVDREEQNGACGSVLNIRPVIESSNTGSLRDEQGSDRALPGLGETDKKALVEVSDGHRQEENEGQGPSLPGDNSDDKKVEGRNANCSEMTITSCAVSEMESEPQLAGSVGPQSEPQLAGKVSSQNRLARNVSHPSVDSQSSGQVGSGCRKESDLDTNSAGKSRVISFQQNGHFASMESSTLFSVPIKYQRHSSSNAILNVGANGVNDEHSQKIVGTVDCKQRLSGYSLSDPVESSRILRGYPVSVQTFKLINGDVNCKKDVPSQNVSKRDGKLHSGRHTDFSLQKCTSSRHRSDIVKGLFPSQEDGGPSKPISSCSSNLDSSSRNGDVKLFGKILISSQQKPNSCVQGTRDDNGQDHKAESQSLNLKFDSDNYRGSDNVPVRSFGFWDRKMTETGFPDPTVLLTKSFNNHSTPVVKLEQPSIHGFVRSNETPLNGVSVYPSRELSTSNGITEYQVLRDRELQPFTMEMKQPQDVLFTEVQRRNGFDLVSGMQQQSRGMVGINVVGRGGVLVGGQCSGVSDPVTAIKMQYAKPQNISVQTGNVIREDDKWRNDEDAGR